LELNKYFKAKLVLVNCFTPEQPMAELSLHIDPTFSQDYRLSAEKKIKDMESEIQELQIMDYEYIIKMRMVPDGILEAARDINADLVIMGTRGTNTKLQDLFGSNAYAMIRNSPVPVLAIPANITFRGFNRILFCADYQEIENTKPLEIIREFINISDAHLEILHFNGHVTKMKDEEIDELLSIRKFFSGIDFSFHRARQKKISDGVEDHLKRRSADLVILLHRKHFFPESIFKEKVTKQTVAHSKIPVLALPELKESKKDREEYEEILGMII